MKLNEAIQAYIDEFDEGPPIFDMEEDEAVRRIEQAIKAGEPMDEGAEADIPENALL